MRTNLKKSVFHVILTGTGLAILGITIAAVMVHFSWNMVAPDLFGMAKMNFVNATGLVIFLGTLAAVIGQALRHRQLRSDRHTAKSDATA